MDLLEMQRRWAKLGASKTRRAEVGDAVKKLRPTLSKNYLNQMLAPGHPLVQYKGHTYTTKPVWHALRESTIQTKRVLRSRGLKE